MKMFFRAALGGSFFTTYDSEENGPRQLTTTVRMEKSLTIGF